MIFVVQKLINNYANEIDSVQLRSNTILSTKYEIKRMILKDRKLKLHRIAEAVSTLIGHKILL